MSCTAVLEPCSTSGNLSSLNPKTEYRSLKEDPVREFYRPCLLNSIIYRRAVGYFKSTVYNVIGVDIVEFSRRGGHTLIICSPDLSEEDIDSISSGYAQRDDIISKSLIEQIDLLMNSERTASSARILATLISVGSLDIKLAVLANTRGLYHEKIGIFEDSYGNAVSFKGSANETWRGWSEHGNFESIEVFCNWRDGLERERVKNHVRHFDTLWSQEDSDIEVLAFPSEASEYLKNIAARDLNSLAPKNSVSLGTHRTPLPHQDAAVRAWLSRGSRGIFEHATGSGKTYTALMAIRWHVDQERPVLIVVPSRLLLDQWATEIKGEIPDVTLLLAGGTNNTWKTSQRMRGMTGSDTSGGPRIVLATMQTASMDLFRNSVSDGEHLMLVADEVHQVGSPQHSRILTLRTGPRLGLSATPTRYGDPEGTKQILDYFGGIVPPTITLSDAIQAGRLVPYEYFPHLLNLSTAEADQWRNLTERICREIARQSSNSDEGGQRPLSQSVKLLLIQRSRIAKKAEAKVSIACSVLSRNFAERQSWLVYCEDSEQLASVIDSLRQKGFNPVEYHSNMSGDRDATMSWFRSFGGVLVSIRCLDEGVDIPDVSHALILASSQNPRQFIQRRGRVLRRAPGKELATVHDAIVAPVDAVEEPEQVSLLKSELARAAEFANHAINRGAGAGLREIAINMGINPSSLLDKGIEDDEEGSS